MRYTITGLDSVFVKAEGDNCVVVSRTNGHTIFLNRVATWIFNRLDTCSSSEELLEQLVQQFANVSRDILKSDLLSFLHVMEVYQILLLHDDAQNDINEEPKISIADDSSFKSICDFISNSETINWFQRPYLEAGFSPLVLHQKSFSNDEVFVYYKENNELKIVASFKMPTQNSKVLVLNRLYSKGLEKNRIAAYTRLIITRFLSKIADVPAKTRAIVFQKTNESTSSNSTVMLLHDCGFKKECELQNEVDDLSAHYYVIYN